MVLHRSNRGICYSTNQQKLKQKRRIAGHHGYRGVSFYLCTGRCRPLIVRLLFGEAHSTYMISGGCIGWKWEFKGGMGGDDSTVDGDKCIVGR